MDTTRAVKRLGNMVKVARKGMGFNQRQFAKLFGTSHPSISNLENGKFIYLPDHSTLIKLAQILHIPYWQLIRCIEEEEEEIELPEKYELHDLIVGINELEELEDGLDLNKVLADKIEKLRSKEL